MYSERHACLILFLMLSAACDLVDTAVEAALQLGSEQAHPTIGAGKPSSFATSSSWDAS